MTASTLPGSVAATAAVRVAAPAGADRRFHAFLVDRLVTWSAAGTAASLLRDRPWAAALAVLLVVLASAAGLGRWGVSVGKVVFRLRVVAAYDGRPIGFARALLRVAVLDIGTLATLGIGTAVLARTAVMDPTGRRRGWHDSLAASYVVDVRPAHPAEGVAVVATPVVNLTTARLASPVPVSAPPTRTEEQAAYRWGIALDGADARELVGQVRVGTCRLRVVPDGALVAMDDGPTGGLLVRGGFQRRLDRGRPTTLRDGDRLRVGDQELVVTRLGHR